MLSKRTDFLSVIGARCRQTFRLVVLFSLLSNPDYSRRRWVWRKPLGGVGFGCRRQSEPSERPPTLKDDTLVLPSLSPTGDKPISALIDDRCTSAKGGLLLFQEVERRLNLADRLASCLHDPRQPGKITHSLDEIVRFRMLAIVAGSPDGNDCDVLRGDPVFKMALDRPPVSGPALCSQTTVSRIENCTAKICG
jgi:hypothetical protein